MLYYYNITTVSTDSRLFVEVDVDIFERILYEEKGLIRVVDAMVAAVAAVVVVVVVVLVEVGVVVVGVVCSYLEDVCRMGRDAVEGDETVNHELYGIARRGRLERPHRVK